MAIVEHAAPGLLQQLLLLACGARLEGRLHRAQRGDAIDELRGGAEWLLGLDARLGAGAAALPCRRLAQLRAGMRCGALPSGGLPAVLRALLQLPPHSRQPEAHAPSQHPRQQQRAVLSCRPTCAKSSARMILGRVGVGLLAAALSWAPDWTAGRR
jgi:hypothetical protein